MPTYAHESFAKIHTVKQYGTKILGWLCVIVMMVVVVVMPLGIMIFLNLVLFFAHLLIENLF